ncbi:MAG: dihydroorotate dehydrogenase-like protein [Phycisphaerae bacterium]|jgi:dihydroorotate dehydrogenase (fumarate)
MDLSTTYMGLKLTSPLVASASPLCMDVGEVRKMEDHGAGAVVLASLFQEQIEHDAEELDFYLHYGTDRWAESLTYFPHKEDYKLGPEAYLAHIAAVKKAVSIPVFASLNGISAGGWTSYAKKMQDAGANGIELNIYFIPADPRLGSEQVEQRYLSVLKAVKSAVHIPVAVKLSPYFSATASMATRLDAEGADALVLFNRFYQPDIDIEKLEIRPRLELSTPWEGRLPLRWIAILFGKLAKKASLAATTGIHTAEDVAKMILAGADVTMMTSALLRHGVEHLAKVRAGLVEIMQAKEYESVAQMKGVLSQKSVPDPEAFERANYMKTLQSFGLTATKE